ncbi:MAG: hypothetical protein EBX41_09875, partial [Chitinophagia bacterium]|nr:hypothetical protein [Chitinophagia bacterium]
KYSVMLFTNDYITSNPRIQMSGIEYFIAANGIAVNKTVYGGNWGVAVGYLSSGSLTGVFQNKFKGHPRSESYLCPQCDMYSQFYTEGLTRTLDDFKINEYQGLAFYKARITKHQRFILSSGFNFRSTRCLVSFSTYDTSTKMVTRHEKIDLLRDWSFVGQAGYEYLFLKNHVGVGVDIRYRRWLAYKAGNSLYAGVASFLPFFVVVFFFTKKATPQRWLFGAVRFGNGLSKVS